MLLGDTLKINQKSIILMAPGKAYPKKSYKEKGFLLISNNLYFLKKRYC